MFDELGVAWRCCWICRRCCRCCRCHSRHCIGLEKVKPIGTTDYTNLSRFVWQIRTIQTRTSLSQQNMFSFVSHHRACAFANNDLPMNFLLLFSVSLVRAFFAKSFHTPSIQASKYQITYDERHSPCPWTARVCVCMYVRLDATQHRIIFNFSDPFSVAGL